MKKGNDSKILELKKKIEEKKNGISFESFKPLTNCNIELDGYRSNINTMNQNGLVILLVRLNSLKMAHEDLIKKDSSFASKLDISGFELSAWITDVTKKLKIIKMKDEERKLKILEDQLTQLLSEDTKTEIQINDIEKSLKDL